MAISKVDRLAAAAQSSAGGATVWTTASITPVAERLIVLFIGSDDSGTQTVTGCGLTWTKVKARATGAYLNIFAAWTGQSPSSGALTITTTTNCNSMLYFAYEFAGVYYDGDVNNCFRQWGDEGHSPAAGSATCTLASSFLPDSWMINMIINNSNSSANLTSDHNTNKTQVSGGATGSVCRLGVQWYDGEDLSMTWTWSGSIYGCSAAAELLAAKSEFPKIMMVHD